MPDYVEHLHFSDVLDEYCIRVQGNDLRNGGSEIVEFCASPVRPLATLSLDAIGNCSEPPPAQHERWCRAPDHEEVRTTAQLAECERLLGTGEGGSAGEASSSAGGSGNGGSGARGPSAGGDGGREQTGGNGGRSPTGGSNGAGTGATGTPEPAETAGAGSEETDDAGGTQRVLTDGGCGCRTAGDPSRPYGALALAGLFALAARLGFRRRRTGAVS